MSDSNFLHELEVFTVNLNYSRSKTLWFTTHTTDHWTYIQLPLPDKDNVMVRLYDRCLLCQDDRCASGAMTIIYLVREELKRSIYIKLCSFLCLLKVTTTALAFVISILPFVLDFFAFFNIF